MTNTNDFTARFTAAFSAIAVTATLLVASFSNPQTNMLSAFFA